MTSDSLQTFIEHLENCQMHIQKHMKDKKYCFVLCEIIVRGMVLHCYKLKINPNYMISKVK